MNENPYQTPVTSGYTHEVAPGGVSPQTVELLARTQGWVRFISILLLIVSGLVLVSLVMSFVANLASGRGGDDFFLFPALVMLLALLLYIYPAIKLSSYAAAIRRLRASHSLADLNAALDAQRAFWRFVGIATIVGIVSYIIIIIAMTTMFRGRVSRSQMSGPALIGPPALLSERR